MGNLSEIVQKREIEMYILPLESKKIVIIKILRTKKK